MNLMNMSRRLLWVPFVVWSAAACGGTAPTGPEKSESSGTQQSQVTPATKLVAYVYGSDWEIDPSDACSNAEWYASRKCPGIGSGWDTCATWVVSNRRIDGGWECVAEAECCLFQ